MPPLMRPPSSLSVLMIRLAQQHRKSRRARIIRTWLHKLGAILVLPGMRRRDGIVPAVLWRVVVRRRDLQVRVVGGGRHGRVRVVLLRGAPEPCRVVVMFGHADAAVGALVVRGTPAGAHARSAAGGGAEGGEAFFHALGEI